MTAVDIGCGIGTESIELLQFGFRVQGIDFSYDSHHSLENLLDDKYKFESTLRRIFSSVKANGVFAGTLFGDQDEWVLSGHCNERLLEMGNNAFVEILSE